MLLIRRARVPVALLPREFASEVVDPREPAVLCDIAIAGGRITRVTRAAAAVGGEAAPDGVAVVDAAGELVFPGFVDAHTHLDKAHTWHRTEDARGLFAEALRVLGADKENWTAEDLHRRAGFSLRCAYAHGTRIIRTHIDTWSSAAETSHAVMAELRAQWAGKVEVQTVPLTGGANYASADGEKLADLALKYGASALGGFLIMGPELPAQIERLLAIARQRGVGIDLHVDENGNPQAECLRLVTEAVLRTEFPYPVVCGHCCSLAVQPTPRQQSTIALLKEARVGVISLPMCNLYLQDRRPVGATFPRSPQWRGLTLVKDLIEASVPVACASDNVRDAFYAFGDFNLAEVYAQSVRLAHLDETLADSVCVVTRTAADLVGRSEFGRVMEGAPAHLVMFAAHRFSELLSRPATLRRRIDGEHIHTPVLPDYAELQDAER